MDKIWFRNPSKSEVIGHCGGEENTELSRRTDKSRKKNKKIVVSSCYVDTYLHHNIHAGYTDVNWSSLYDWHIVKTTIYELKHTLQIMVITVHWRYVITQYLQHK